MDATLDTVYDTQVRALCKAWTTQPSLRRYRAIVSNCASEHLAHPCPRGISALSSSGSIDPRPVLIDRLDRDAKLFTHFLALHAEVVQHGDVGFATADIALTVEVQDGFVYRDLRSATKADASGQNSAHTKAPSPVVSKFGRHHNIWEAV